MSNAQDIKSEITKTLVESGKYDEINTILKQRLYEIGWVADLRARLSEILSTCDNVNELKFSNILDQLDLNEFMNDKIDLETKKLIVGELSGFLLDNFEMS